MEKSFGMRGHPAVEMGLEAEALKYGKSPVLELTRKLPMAVMEVLSWEMELDMLEMEDRILVVEVRW